MNQIKSNESRAKQSKEVSVSKIEDKKKTS